MPIGPEHSITYERGPLDLHITVRCSCGLQAQSDSSVVAHRLLKRRHDKEEKETNDDK